MMRKYGEIKLCKLVVDFYGVSKGYGYVYFTDAKSAESALKDLSEKILDGKTPEVCHLIPGKTKENYRNNIYVKNLPKYFTDEDLKKFFEKHGEIKSAVVSKDETGSCRGFGFVCFINPGHANSAFKEMKEKQFQFEGLEPLYLNYAQKKDERIEMLMKDNFKLEKLTVFAKLRDDMYLIKTESEFEKELKDLIKLLMLEDYSPRDMKIKMDTRTALVTMNSQKDLEELMNKYVEYSQFYLPRIFLNYYQNKNERSVTSQYVNELNAMINPVNMFSNFANLSIHDPEKKPIFTIDPSQLHKKHQVSEKKTNNYNNYYGNGSYRQNSYSNYHSKNYKKGRKNESQYRKKKEYTTQLVEYKDERQSEKDNISVQTPIYEKETKEDIASQIYEIVEKKYHE
jgi:RNA recognition motif-containing protein